MGMRNFDGGSIMSRGALKELTRATTGEFTLLLDNIPHSERPSVARIFKNYVTILGGTV
jgi:hypothetical protein